MQFARVGPTEIVKNRAKRLAAKSMGWFERWHWLLPEQSFFSGMHVQYSRIACSLTTRSACSFIEH